MKSHIASFAFFIATLALFAASHATERGQFIAPKPQISSIVLIHYAPTPTGEPEKRVSELLRTKYRFFERRSTEKAERPGNTVFVDYVDLKAENFAPPSLRLVKAFGKGVSDEQGQALQKSTHALVLIFSYTDRDIVKAIDELSRLAYEVASETRGVIWDDEARLLYATANWKEARIESVSDGVPDISRHIAIHQYKNGEFVRSISLGLQKFGLPDLIVEDHSWSTETEMSDLISLLAQSMSEGQRPPWVGNFDLKINAVRHSKLRERITKYNKDNATGVGLLRTKEGKRYDGDPDNDLVEIAFDRYPGKGVQERQAALAAKMFGWTEEVSYVKHDDEIKAESERARKRFEALRPMFNAGLAPGERIIVKAPFRMTDGGNEWMWVEVNTWKGDMIVGLLANEPDKVLSLHIGSRVTVRQSDIFDYLWYKHDGTEEGNTTGPLIERWAK